jgi:hypothetical protein
MLHMAAHTLASSTHTFLLQYVHLSRSGCRQAYMWFMYGICAAGNR